MNWKEYREKLLSNPEVKEEYDKLEPEYELARSIIRERIRKKMTQKELAEKIGTKQPSIARLERGFRHPPDGKMEFLNTHEFSSFESGVRCPKFRKWSWGGPKLNSWTL